MKRRIWEIDLARVIAIFLMIVFHFIYNLAEFTDIDISYTHPPWNQIGTTAALLFMFVSGISSGLSKGSVRRGLKVLAYGMIVTAVTYIFIPEMYIRFGILHFLGVSMIISPLLRRINNWILLLLTVIIAYNPLGEVVVNTPYFLPLGIKYRGFYSADYYPLIPYLSVFILGILAYKIYYHKRKSLFNFSLENHYITFMSKNSLLIYLLHQPILIAGLYIFGMINF